MLLGLLQGTVFRYIGIGLLCLSLGYMKGCSSGKAEGKAIVQREFDSYKTQIAVDIQNNNAEVVKLQQEIIEAQTKLAKEIAERRSKVEREIAAIKDKVNNVFSERVTNPDCKYTADELRLSQEAFDRVKNSRKRNPSN